MHRCLGRSSATDRRAFITTLHLACGAATFETRQSRAWYEKEARGGGGGTTLEKSAARFVG